MKKEDLLTYLWLVSNPRVPFFYGTRGLDHEQSLRVQKVSKKNKKQKKQLWANAPRRIFSRALLLGFRTAG